MPPKKTSPLDKIRAKAAKNRAAQAVALRDSAWHQIAVRNAEVAPARKVEEILSAPVAEEKKPKKKVVAKEVVDKPNKITKPSSSSTGVKRKASVAKIIKKEKPKPREEEIDSDTSATPLPKSPSPESWTPAGGLTLSSSSVPPSRTLAIARIPGWRVEKFSLALGELLLNLDVEDDFRIKVKSEEEVGIQKLTDVFVKFDGVEEAEEAKRKIDGKVLSGRVMRVGFAV
ncbi:putative nucleotide-binding alpha-beta plait domain superfamily, RNA-binding domain superfamily [Septoria linicola]|nr:putative nucleotide-binding alpha-beta plait domain superfamily, RNA-binding domain superfamily [Septoria linicola]